MHCSKCSTEQSICSAIGVMKLRHTKSTPGLKFGYKASITFCCSKYREVLERRSSSFGNSSFFESSKLLMVFSSAFALRSTNFTSDLVLRFFSSCKIRSTSP